MINDYQPDNEAARAWRMAKGYTQKGLAHALGVSAETVLIMERGTRAGGKPIGAAAWQRYCLMCAGLHHLEGAAWHSWDWVG